MQYITTETKNSLQDGYKLHEPFSFKVIDNFLSNDCLQIILNHVNNLKDKDCTSKFSGSVYEHNKVTFTKNFNKELDDLFTYLVSDEFIDYIEKLTNISGLIRNDKTLLGGGVHRIHKDGYLKTHTDFNSYTHSQHGDLDRRINLILYLNENWTNDYGGHLILSDKFNKKNCFRILPILNRCVIFNTSNKSLHGHPEPLTCPENRSRQSIAVYYYTKKVGDTDFEGDKPHCTMWYDISNYDNRDIINV